MKTTWLHAFIVICMMLIVSGESRSDETNNVAAGASNVTVNADNAVTNAGNATAAVCTVVPPPTIQPAEIPFGTNDVGKLRINFRGAPIDLILNYLSEAAGFIIDLRTPVKGTVDVWSNQPVTREEAVDILNSVLNKNGYAAVRNGKTLIVFSRSDALTADIPVKVGNEPGDVPKNDELVTQIIPIKFVESLQLVKDLSPMVSARATIVANEAGNSIVITDTQTNIRHLMEIIKAVDSSAETMTELRVFKLKFHDPEEIANILTDLFSEQSGSSGSQTPVRVGQGSGSGRNRSGFAGMPFNPFGGPPGSAGSSSGSGQAADRIKKRERVVAVPDQRTTSVVVVASKDLIGQISDMIDQLDHEATTVSHVSVFHLENADPQQVQRVLQDMYQTTSSRNSSSQSSPLQHRLQQGTTGSGSSSSSSSGIGGSRSGFGSTSLY